MQRVHHTTSDFLPGGSLAVATGDEIIPVAMDLLKGHWNFAAASQVSTPVS